MNMTFDQNLFTQTGLDSGLLTMLGAVIHSLPEPGEYRGSVHKAGGEQAVFYITVDKNSPVAHADIDLATLREYATNSAQKECCGESTENRFTVNPKGYVVFHVSGGSGGFSVHLRRAEEDPKTQVFNSQELGEGDIFSATILRPGTYSVVNLPAKARGELVVSYPEIGKAAYRPPAPLHVQVTQRGFEPARVELKPGQGVVFEIKASARIVTELLKPDDGPSGDRPTTRRGWAKHTLPETKA
jgi:plastocyanin